MNPATATRLNRWHAVASVAWVIVLTTYFLIAAERASDRDLIPESAETGYAVWMGLVMFQFLLWGTIAYINLGVYSRVRLEGASPRPVLVFALGVSLVNAAPIAVGSLHAGGSILGSSDALYSGFGIQIGALLSVFPALFVVQAIRSTCARGRWDMGRGAVESLERLRRAMNVAIASLGVAIAVGIIGTNLVNRIQRENVDDVPIEPEHVLLYGAVLTAIVFGVFLYAKSAIDGRARSLIDRAAPTERLDRTEEFLARAQLRSDLGEALGLGVKTRERFENLVVVASPLLGAVLANFVAGSVD